MIPADDFLIDGNAAWLAVDAHTIFPPTLGEFRWDGLDAPCDTCDGHGIFEAEASWEIPCDCIDGRHTFDIEVDCGSLDCYWCDDPDQSDSAQEPDDHEHLVSRLRVSVVPGMVLPIVSVWPIHAPAIHHDPTSPVSEWWWTYAVENGWNKPINLPPGARPGRWAVKVRVAS